MPDSLRLLNDDGIQAFRDFLTSAREGSAESTPVELMQDPSTSTPIDATVTLARMSFAGRYAFGEYLSHCLARLDRQQIVNDFRLWTSLALYYFDQLCPPSSKGRNVLADALYILEPQFNHRRYYRHLVRTPWIAVSQHEHAAKVILITRNATMTSEIGEQLASRQELLGNRTVISAAYRLYFDEREQKPKRGASGKGAGSPRRLSTVIKQLMLTYDLESCTTEQFLDLLPKEFDRFKAAKETVTPGFRSRIASFLDRLGADQPDSV